MTERQLEQSYPQIRWREPVEVRVTGGKIHGLGCRFCIAQVGLKAADVAGLPHNKEEFEKHMREVHGL